MKVASKLTLSARLSTEVVLLTISAKYRPAGCSRFKSGRIFLGGPVHAGAFRNDSHMPSAQDKPDIVLSVIGAMHIGIAHLALEAIWYIPVISHRKRLEGPSM